MIDRSHDLPVARQARELGISGVPFFLIDGKYAVNGAQEPDTLRTAFAEIARREAVDAG